MKEYKVGQIVTIKGTKCRVTKSDGSCDGCVHRNSSDHCGDNKGEYECMASCRSDGNNVIFKPISSTSKVINKKCEVVTPKQENIALGASKQSEFPLPPESMRVWIRGNKERGEEVIKALTDLGAKNTYYQGGSNEKAIYYICCDGQTDAVQTDSLVASLIANFYKEIKLPWKPKDKELVWCWNENFTCGRSLMFYDKKNDRVYSFGGKRNGLCYDNYAPYEGEYPEWAKEALKKLEE